LILRALTFLRKGSDKATLLPPWFIGKQDLTAGVAPAQPNGRKSWIYQQKLSKKATRDNPARSNPGRDIDDLTHPVFCGLNRFSSDFLR
jgi:hypothetical protein